MIRRTLAGQREAGIAGSGHGLGPGLRRRRSVWRGRCPRRRL